MAPLPTNTFGIVLGRASLSLMGLQITPVVIDTNHQGEIQILASTTGGPVFIPTSGHCPIVAFSQCLY
jgi:deoxycytidine triphosphate deaminase